MSEKGKSETAKREEEILAFWKQDKTFEKSLTKHAPKGEFIFYDGPPFATGLPHHAPYSHQSLKTSCRATKPCAATVCRAAGGGTVMDSP